MKWAVAQVLVLILAIVVSNSACAMICANPPCHDDSSTPPCHQKHGIKLCANVFPVSDVTVSTVPEPAFVTQSLLIPAAAMEGRLDRLVAFSPRFTSIPILRI